MCLFLAINTSSVTLLPLGAIGVRAAAGSANPASIFLPTLIATICSTVSAIVIATLLSRKDRAYLSSSKSSRVDDLSGELQNEADAELPNYDHLVGTPGTLSRYLALGSIAVFIGIAIAQMIASDSWLTFLSKDLATYWLMPLLMLLIVSYGVARGVHVYEAVTEGAKQGFDIAIKIIPYLVAILVAVAVFRASGAMDVLAWCLGPLTSLIGMPPEVLPMALVRPLSGSGAFGVMSALVEAAPNSYSAFLASVMMGSTETTFYVLAVYFGAIGVSKVRHALIAALCADIVGIVVACFAASLFWTG
jgi:spore maturation protein SpmB